MKHKANVIYDYILEVLGTPTAQGRPRATRMGKHIHVYDDKKSRNAKSNLLAAIEDQAPETPLNCPLQVDLIFYIKRPKGHYGSGRNAGKVKASAPFLHTSRPDIDNLRKLVMDAMTDVFWRDDSLVCVGTTEKMYSEKPRTVIKIALLGKSN